VRRPPMRARESLKIIFLQNKPIFPTGAAHI
jgi:hypothetical protein